MSAMLLIIKGSERTARRECHKRGFAVREAHETRPFETNVTGDGDEIAVARWMAEPGNAPYPAGTLLFYQVSR